MALADNIQRYENNFGEIDLHESSETTPFISAVDA